MIGGDGMTEAIRRKLQQRFGDAGHGFHVMGKYSRWYPHRGMRYEERSEWDTCLIIFKCRPEHALRLCGRHAASRAVRAQSRWQPRPRRHRPAGVALRALVPEAPRRWRLRNSRRRAVEQVIDSRAPGRSDEVDTVRVPDGQHAFRGGRARLRRGSRLRRGLGARWARRRLGRAVPDRQLHAAARLPGRRAPRAGRCGTATST